MIAIIALLYDQYRKLGNTEAENPAISQEQKQVKPVAVSVANAFVGEMVQYITATGNTEAKQFVDVKPLISARVMAVHVRDGQPVANGAVLVDLDDREYRVAVAEARATLLNARAEYALRMSEIRDDQKISGDIAGTNGFHAATEQFQIFREKYSNGEIPEAEYRQAERRYLAEKVFSGENRDDLIAQQSGLAAAEAQFARAEYGLENCRITAPFSGIIGDVQVHPGDVVSPGQTLFSLVDLQRLKLKLAILESEFGFVRENENITAVFPAFPGRDFSGTITGINPQIDPQTRTGSVVAAIDNPDGLLKSGMFGAAKIVVNRYPGRLMVPRAAVVERDQRKLVFIVRDEKAFWCYVDTGLENDEFIEVTGSAFDLKPGEPVIVDGHFALAHNADVMIQE